MEITLSATVIDCVIVNFTKSSRYGRAFSYLSEASFSDYLPSDFRDSNAKCKVIVTQTSHDSLDSSFYEKYILIPRTKFTDFIRTGPIVPILFLKELSHFQSM